MRSQYLKILLMFFLLTVTHASTNYNHIDKYARNTPDEAAVSIEALAEYLIKPAKNDFEKARAIYMWIVFNIKYDYDALRKRVYEGEKIGINRYQAELVLKERMAVCGGYSKLFVALTQQAGFESEVVSGWVKDIDAAFGPNVYGSGTNHAWTTIKIERKWYLVEPTWGTGYGNGRNPTNKVHYFDQKMIDYCFLVPPGRLIYTHYPNNPKHQLLTKPISRKEFDEAPYLFPGFFINGLKMVTPKNFHSYTNKKTSIVLEGKIWDEQLYCSIYKNSLYGNNMKANKGKTLRFRKTRKKNVLISVINFDEAGEYIVLVTATSKMGFFNNSGICALYRFTVQNN